MSARPLSNSNMPISNTPTTRKLLMRGSVPAGVTTPCGVITITGSPRRTPSARASSAPSTMPKEPGLKIAQGARAHVAVDVGHLRFERGIDAAHERAAVDLARREHGLPEHVGRGGKHARIRLRQPRHGRPVLDRAVERADFDVRRYREDARAQLLLEAVHHRQHHDERGDAQSDAEHRYRGDEGDESVTTRATARARVAQADEQFIG